MAVTRAEFEPIAREHLARCMEAFDILLTSGPHLVALVDRELLSPDLVCEVENVAGSLLRRATAWPDFEARYRQSPWQCAPELLAMDPQASLPQAAP